MTRNGPPIVECAYGWGRKVRLYPEYLEVHNTSYPLKDLTYIRSAYRTLLGVPSARLEIHFGKRSMVLRGIAALEDVQYMLAYVNTHFPGKDWSMFDSGKRQNPSAACVPPEELAMLLTPMSTLQECSPVTEQDVCTSDFAAAQVEAPSWQQMRQERRERRVRRLRVEHALREHGFDVEALECHLREETLPIVAVPLQLLSGEQAHYSTDATLCGEPIIESARCTYPARDHGTLIFTNRRVIYLGRRSQIVLDYDRLLHTSRLRGAIAFHVKEKQKREIFEVQRPLESTMYLDCLLQRYREEHALENAVSTSAHNFMTDAVRTPSLVDGIETIPLSLVEWAHANMLAEEEREAER